MLLSEVVKRSREQILFKSIHESKGIKERIYDSNCAIQLLSFVHLNRNSPQLLFQDTFKYKGSQLCKDLEANPCPSTAASEEKQVVFSMFSISHVQTGNSYYHG